MTRARLENVGVIGTKAAAELGVAGLFARASGINFDARRDMPYDACTLFKITPAVERGGDALARTMVRWGEVAMSIQLVREAIKDLLQGDIIDEALLFKNPEHRQEGISGTMGYTYLHPKPGEWTGLAEATRGLTRWTTGLQRVYGMRFVTPSWRNLKAMIGAMKGARLADMPAIHMSFGYFPPEADR